MGTLDPLLLFGGWSLHKNRKARRDWVLALVLCGSPFCGWLKVASLSLILCSY